MKSNVVETKQSSRPNVEELKGLQRKIHRYVKQNKFTNNEIEYLDRLFEMDITNSPKQTAITEMGTMRVINNYSTDTIIEVKSFLKECENKWKKEKEQRLFPLSEEQSETKGKKRASVSLAGAAANSTKKTKKPKVVDNPLIQTVADSPEEDTHVPDDALKDVPATKKVEKHPLASQMKIIDNKKHPLSFYKGSLKRTMRVVRNIGGLNAIEEYSKARTSENITSEHVASNNTAVEEYEDDPELEDNLSDGGSSDGFEALAEKVDENEQISDEEEESFDDDDSDIVKEDFDDLYRRHNDGIYDEEEEEEEFDEDEI